MWTSCLAADTAHSAMANSRPLLSVTCQSPCVETVLPIPVVSLDASSLSAATRLAQAMAAYDPDSTWHKAEWARSSEFPMSRITPALRHARVRSAVRGSMPAKLRGLGKGVPSLPLLRKEVASNGAGWLPLVWVSGAIAAVGYADHRVSSISLGYLYMLPLGVGAIFLRRTISYGLIAVCILFHDYYSPRNIHLGLRIFHNLSALLCFAFVVYIIERYIEQREALAKTVQQQRDDLLQDVKLAAQVQRLFLPMGKPAIAGLEIAGMMRPARGVSGDYYDYIPIDAHTIHIVIADVSGKGVPAPLLMSATAAAVQLEANHAPSKLHRHGTVNTGIRPLPQP